jgi:lipopolysaccharide export system protein LptA
MRLVTFILCLIYLFCWAPASQAQGELKNTPIRIEADRMETSQEDSTVVFSGNVQANQAELFIHADQMTVLYAKTPGTSADNSSGTAVNPIRNIERIKATGNVKIVQENWIATGDSMDFNAADRIITLTGNAKAWQDKNMVSGEKIILYLDEGKSVVEKSTQEGERVKAFIYPSANEPPPKKKDESTNPADH